MHIRQPITRRDAGPGHAAARESAFTMVEIALSLGIIAFALIAIIGVLPSGLKVQRENREETIINQDAGYLLEAIRSGSTGMDDLTNFVESVSVRRGNQVTIYTNNVRNPGGFLPLTNGQHIVSLLSTPKMERLANGNFRLNSVSARVRAISGGALEKSRQLDDFAFRYHLISEVMPLTNVPPQVLPALPGQEVLRSANLVQNLYEVRLTMRWPLFEKGASWDVGRYRRTVRTLVSGELNATYTNSAPYLYLFDPGSFASYH